MAGVPPVGSSKPMSQKTWNLPTHLENSAFLIKTWLGIKRWNICKQFGCQAVSINKPWLFFSEAKRLRCGFSRAAGADGVRDG